MASRPISAADLLTPAEYERRRAELRARAIALKTRRRVEVGPWVSFVFENRETVLYQIQEMVRVERLTDPAAVAHEIETYSDLLPGPGELSATMFIEISDAEQRSEALAKLHGVEKAVSLTAGAHRVAAEDKCPIDPRYARPRAAAVYYLRLPVPEAARSALASGAESWLRVDHPEYRHAGGLPAALAREFAGELS